MKKYLGIEFGSTRIKAVLIDERGSVLCSGGYEWENSLVDGWWSYDLAEVIKGMQSSYAELSKEYKAKYNESLIQIDAIGISAMMHGYLALDGQDNLLAPFRTWRNTRTQEAAKELSAALKFNMPQRWSATHYYQAVLSGEKHANSVAHLHTLSSYVHYLLTGKNVVGANDASGMFPLLEGDYDKARIQKYNALLKAQGIDKDIYKLLPKVMLAGENAGILTKQGAKLLDPSGNLQAGVVCCPPEGDMATGMVCTNAVAQRTANVSSGTSTNMTVILEKPLKKYYPEIDIIATPDGYAAALLHTNNCTTEINEWVSLFSEVATLCGADINKGELFTKLFNKSLECDERVGKLVGYNYLAGEPLAKTGNGAPLIVRSPDGELNLANFMQMQIYSANAAIALGMDILRGENVNIDSVTAHGGFYKTEFVGQNALSATLDAPVTVVKNAGEGGAWGIALLALYAANKKSLLAEFLQDIFRNVEKATVMATDEEKKKFAAFMQGYKANLAVEKLASEVK